jgi:hypothetical protein
MRNCTNDSGIMRNEDWAHPDYAYPARCYFYPGRLCPGWSALGTCGRVGNRIPADAGSSREPDDRPA